MMWRSSDSLWTDLGWPASIATASLALASLLSSPAARESAAQVQAAADPLRVEWATSCREESPGVLCVEAGSTEMQKLEKYSTLQVDFDGRGEQRYQTTGKVESTVVLARVPACELCLSQRLEHRNATGPCGPLEAADPQAACKSDAAAPKPCKLRLTPFDNPSFPDFPDPSVANPGYFAPWPAYDRPGGMPGDLDDIFFDNLGKLRPDPQGSVPDKLSPARRRAVELLAWQELVALQWPVVDHRGARIRESLDRAGAASPLADPACSPGEENPPAASGPPANAGEMLCPVWSGWRRKAEVDSGTSALPIPWGIFPTTDGGGRACRGSREGGPPLAELSATEGELGRPLGPPRVHAAQPSGSGHILFDANHVFVFYDTRVNRGLYEDILRNELYRPDMRSPQGTKLRHGRMFPNYQRGIVKDTPEHEGPVAAKFAWKPITTCDRAEDFVLSRSEFRKVDRDAVLADIAGSRCNDEEPQAETLPLASPIGAGDAAAPAPMDRPKNLRYLEAVGLVATESTANPPFSSVGSATVDPAAPEVDCPLECEGDVCLFGLVAVHVAHKTKTSNLWNWATFAHRDALRPRPGRKALFVAGGCGPGGSSCNECDEEGRCATQVCATFEPAPSTRALNDQVAEVLDKSPAPLLRQLSNYELLGVQFLGDGGPTIEGLLNPLMETFVTSHRVGDCYSCHRHAEEGDFLFFLKPPGPRDGEAPSGEAGPPH